MTPSARRHGVGSRKHAESGPGRHATSGGTPSAALRAVVTRANTVWTAVRTRLGRRGSVIAGIVTGLLLLTVIAGVLLSSRASVKVPSLIGVSEADAGRRAKALGLTLVVRGTELSVGVAKGLVASQDPTAGVVVSAGSKLTVVISAGSGTFAMPDLTGLTLEAARELLRAKGVDVRFVTSPSTAPSGTVISSEPAPGTPVSVGAVVRLTIAASGGGLPLADLSGSSFVLDPAPPASDVASDAAFSVATRLADLLRSAGATVSMTRSVAGAAAAPSVADRLTATHDASATVLIGFSVATSGLEGLQVLTVPHGVVPTSVVEVSAPLADAVFASLRADFASVSTLTANADPVMVGSGLAAVGIRLGSVEAPTDRKLFANPAWADLMARDVFRGLAAIYGGAS